MTRFFNYQFCAIISLTLVSPPASADHPSVAFGSNTSGPINTLSAAPMPAGMWAGSVRTEIIDFDSFSNAQLEGFAEQGLDGVHSVDRLTKTSTAIAYGLTENLSLSLQLPYIERRSVVAAELEDGEPEAHGHGDSADLGDVTLLAQQRIFANHNTDISLLFGIKAPTGKTDLKDDGGERFETEFQPGSGSWDFLTGAAVSKNLQGISVHANILYNATGGGAQSAETGNALFYNAALSYRLGNQLDDKQDHSNHHDHQHASHSDSQSQSANWDLLLEINGETRNKDKVAGVSDSHSGGTTVYLSPGLRLSLGKLSGYLSYGIPILENQQGEQADVDYKLIAGFSVGF
ncbi:MAG: transporter [Porticoccaceae bacterium]